MLLFVMQFDLLEYKLHMHQEIQHRPLIQRFIEAKINNPNLLASLLNFSALIDSTQLKISQLEQRIHQLQNQLQMEQVSLQSASQLRHQHSQQLVQIEDQISQFAHKINLKNQQASAIDDQLSQELQRMQKLIDQEQEEFLSVESSSTQKIEHQLERKKNLQSQILQTNRGISEKNVSIVEIQKLAQKNQKMGQIASIKREQNQELKLKEKQQLASLARSEQLEPNQLKIGKFINEVNDIVANGTVSSLYDLSIKYVADYQLTETELHHKHSSSETRDEEEVEALEVEIASMEEEHPELKANRLSIKVDRTQAYTAHDYGEEKVGLDEKIRLRDEEIEKMEGEEKGLDEFIGDLQTKLKQKESEITALGILRLAGSK